MLINVKIEILFVYNLEFIIDEFIVFVEVILYNYINKIEINFKSFELLYVIR